jgi:hypothetical protein
MLFFVRAFQDAMYAVLLELTGNKPGAKSSMQRCIENEDSPIHKRLVERLPAYLTWFSHMRDQRNRIKNGISTGAQFQIVDGVSDLFVALHVVRGNINPSIIDIKEQVGIANIAEAVEMSADLADLACEWVEEAWRNKHSNHAG